MSVTNPQQLCWQCAHAVPTLDGRHGCEWSVDLRPVPGWTAEMVTKTSFGLTWSITACPKYMPEPQRKEWPY